MGVAEAIVALAIIGAQQIAPVNAIRNPVGTTSGPVQGFVNSSVHNVEQYLGIPYAEAPVDSLRWLPPVPKSKQNATILATSFGLTCPQLSLNATTNPNTYNVDLPLLGVGFAPQGEDCLTLSIWRPRSNTTKEALPVVVWYYGGGFAEGSVDTPYQNPTSWVARTGNHIVVSINYRVNIFGFPNARGLSMTQQNLGLLDQRLGLEWVRSNIASFGGDPSRITTWGQSAGAMSVDYLNYAYPSDPIASGLIMHSGSAQTPFPNLDTLQSNFSFVAARFSCESSTDPSSELSCLRSVPAADLTTFLTTYLNDQTQPPLTFVPIVDNTTVFSAAEYTARTEAGNFSRVPALIGTTRDEGTSFVLPFNATFGPSPSDADTITNFLFLCPITRTSKDRFEAGAPTFRYRYSGNFTNVSPRWWQGAYHSSDLPVLFGTYGIAGDQGTGFQRAVSERMQDLWGAFIRDPVNGLPEVGWDVYQGGTGEVVEFGADGEVERRVAEREVEATCVGA